MCPSFVSLDRTHLDAFPPDSLQEVQWHRGLQQRDPPLYETCGQADHPGPPDRQAHSARADGRRGPGRRAVQRADHILQPAGYRLVVSLLLPRCASRNVM